jgi:hypothetical protein
MIIVIITIPCKYTVKQAIHISYFVIVIFIIDFVEVRHV